MKITKVRMTITIELDKPVMVKVKNEEVQVVSVRVFAYPSGKIGSELNARLRVGSRGVWSENAYPGPWSAGPKPEFQLEAEKMGRDFLAEAENAWEARDDR